MLLTLLLTAFGSTVSPPTPIHSNYLLALAPEDAVVVLAIGNIDDWRSNTAKNSFCRFTKDEQMGKLIDHFAGNLMEQAASHDLYVRTSLEPIYEDAAGVMHDSRGKLTAKPYRKKARSWDAGRSDRPMVHRSVLDRHALELAPIERKPDETVHEAYEPWILRDLTPDQYDVEPWKPADSQDWYQSFG